MSAEDKISRLSQLFASVYSLYLNTQSAHWQVKGPNFYSLHMLFEKQYQAIAEQIDTIAELIVMNNAVVPATFVEIQSLSMIENFSSISDESQLLSYLENANAVAIRLITEMLEQGYDENTNTVLTDLLSYYEKEHWMIKASMAQ